ncbi:MAG: hypothetical protein AAFX53_00075 [Bacteroidota bacterium]
MKINNVFASPWKLMAMVLFTLCLAACSSSDDTPDDPTDDMGTEDPMDDPVDDPVEAQNKSEGFVIIGTTNNNESTLVKYVEELPTGSIDLSDGTDFPAFGPTSIHDHAMFLPRPDGSAGFSKYVVNADGELEEEAILPTISAGSFRMAVLDSERGVFHDRATPNAISIFDPRTMEVIANIDMSSAPVPGDIDQRYQRFFFRGDDVFAPIRGEAGESFTSLIVHQANVSSGSYVGSTERVGDGEGDLLYLNSGGPSADGQGNLYIFDQGVFSVGTTVLPRINKIPAGSGEFDSSYVFEPGPILNPMNLAHTISGFEIIENNQALAVINADIPQAVIDLITEIGGLQNASPDQIQQLLGLVFSSPSARWCILDMEALTVTPIEGIPSVGVFNGGSTFKYNGNVYIPVSTPDESAYYVWDPSTTSATKAFDFLGADIAGVFNLANNR